MRVGICAGRFREQMRGGNNSPLVGGAIERRASENSTTVVGNYDLSLIACLDGGNLPEAPAEAISTCLLS